MIVSLFPFIIVLIPIAAGILLVGLSRRGGLGFPACGRCGYDLSGSIGVATRCPECGGDFANVGIVPPKGRRNRIMVWAGAALIVIPLTCAGVGLASAFVAYQQAAQARSAAVQQQAAIAAQQPATRPADPPPATETAPDESE